jgi:hypothetical protein
MAATRHEVGFNDFHKAHKELLLYENHRGRVRNG